MANTDPNKKKDYGKIPIADIDWGAMVPDGDIGKLSKITGEPYTEKARRDWTRGNPKNKNVFEREFPGRDHNKSTFWGIVHIVFFAALAFGVLLQFLSLVWPGLKTIANILMGGAAIAAVILYGPMIARAIYSKFEESTGLAIGVSVAGLAAAFWILKLGATKLGLVILILTVAFIATYLIKNHKYLDEKLNGFRYWKKERK